VPTTVAVPQSLHPDLLAIKAAVYDPCQFDCSEPQREAESSDYGAYAFELNGLALRFRVAKTTPTKTGQFVTLWKRVGRGPIQPYDLSDPLDLFVVSVRRGSNFGQFVFPKSVLLQQGIVARNNRGGKRAIRVYPPWDQTVSRQAQKTQRWQLDYFLPMIAGDAVDLARARKLYDHRPSSPA
jgi:hypothetical protein